MHSGVEQDRAPGIVPRAAWRVAQVAVLPGWRLGVEFMDKTRGEVELEGLVFHKAAGVFAALRDAKLFSRASLLRGAVAWPGGLELPSDAMYDAIRRSGSWRPEIG